MEKKELICKINALCVCLNIEASSSLDQLSNAVLRGIYVNLVIRTLNSYYEEV